MKLKSLALCTLATVVIAFPALEAAEDFKANLFAVALVVIVAAWGLHRFFQRMETRARWKRAIQFGLAAVALVSVFLMSSSRLLPPPIYENAHYIIDPTDYRYWVHKAAFTAAIPEFVAGVGSIRAVDAITGQRNRGELSFIVTVLMSVFYAVYCVVKVALASLVFRVVDLIYSAVRRKTIPIS